MLAAGAAMSHCVCPWYLGYFLVNPLRPLWHDPRAIVGPYLSEGMWVLEPGPGMGYFTLAMARMVGPTGRVVAIDLQPRMLKGLAQRAERAGLAGRVEGRLAPDDHRLGVEDLAGKVDFVLAFAVVHELGDPAGFFGEAHRALKPGGRLLMAEPKAHVPEADMAASVALAVQAGFAPMEAPSIRGSRSALFRRP
jgi:SAM-dependent methyltransferase